MSGDFCVHKKCDCQEKSLDSRLRMSYDSKGDENE